jgi:hypothetical protein
MHVHSVWYMLHGASATDIVDQGELAVGRERAVASWTTVPDGYVFLWRSSAINQAPDATWTSPEEEFTVAAYVLDHPRFLHEKGGSIVGAAGPSPSANLSLTALWTNGRAGFGPVRTNLREKLPSAEILAVRYVDEVGTHVVDFAEPRNLKSGPLTDAVPEIEQPITGATFRRDEGIINVFDDNQVFFGNVPPELVPRLVTPVGLALWETVQ